MTRTLSAGSTGPAATCSQTIQEGDKLREAGDYEGALRVYDSVIAENPGQVQKEVWYNRGIAQNVLGHYQDASQSFDRVLAMAPGDSLALAQKGAALLGHEGAIPANFNHLANHLATSYK